MNDQRVEVYAGIDWGSQTHQACVLDNHGKRLGERSFAHSGEGIGTLLQWLGEFAGGLASQVASRHRGAARAGGGKSAGRRLCGAFNQPQATGSVPRPVQPVRLQG